MTSIPLLLLVASLLLSCGGRGELTPQSSLDTASTHYERGLQALQDDDLWTAQAQFDRARSLDADHAGSYVGSALVAARQGDHFRARQLLDQALHRDGDFVDAHIALGRVVVSEGLAKGRDTDDWLREAQRAFDEAARLAPQRPEPALFRARAEAQAGRLEAALTSYQRVIGLNAGAVEVAMTEAEHLQIVQRAAPGTRLGTRIAMAPQLNRAELIVLLMEEMRLADLVERRRAVAATSYRPPQVADAVPMVQKELPIAVAWAEPWIDEALSLGVPGLEPLPDGSVGAEQIVTRAALARVLAGILSVLAGDDAAQMARYVGEASRFPDVRSDHFSYGAIALAVDRGILQPDPVSGRFRPDDPVSGAEALLVVRQLQNAVRTEF
jgi:hypothetical protein